VSNSMDIVPQEDREKAAKKRKVMLIVAAFLLIIAALSSIGAYNNHQERVAAEQKKKAEKQYKKNLSSAYDQMVAAGAQMEDIINGYTDVWHSAVWNDGVTIDGAHYTDFNEALAAKRTSYDTNGDLAILDASMVSLGHTMDKLKDPPSKYEDEYEAALSAYASVKDMNNYVEPSGSLQTYSTATSQQDNEMGSELNNFEVRIK